MCEFGIKNGKFVHQNMGMFNFLFMYQRHQWMLWYWCAKYPFGWVHE
jgi:hypothetical protein